MSSRAAAQRARLNLQSRAYGRQLVVLYSYWQGSPRRDEWSFRTITQAQLKALQAAGEVEPIYDLDGMRPGPGAIERCIQAGTIKLLGWKATRPLRRDSASPCSLTPAEMLTAAMPETWKGRDGSPCRMNAGELARLDKYRLWPYIGDDRAVRTGPRPSAVEAGYVDSLLASGKLRPLPTPCSAGAANSISEARA